MAFTSADPVEIFISYAHEDEGLRNQLVKHLANLKRQGVITDWHGRKISPGKRWAKEIDEHLQTAQMILLLISSDFMDSGYCYGIECKRAIERYNADEALVIPVILRPVDLYDSPIAELQALPGGAKPISLWEDRDEAFLSVAKGMREALNELSERNNKRATATPELSLDQPWQSSSKEEVFAQSADLQSIEYSEDGRDHILYVKRPTDHNEKSAAVKILPIKKGRNVKIVLLVIGVLVSLAIAWWLFIYNPPTPLTIHITVIPPYDSVGGSTSNAHIAGTVSGASPKTFRVVIYALTLKTWYVQPTSAEPLTEIQADGSWSAEIQTGVRYAALLVHPDYSPSDTTPDQPSRMAGVVVATEVEGKR